MNRRKKKDRLAAVSPKFDQVFFRSGGCESGGGVPLRASKADETKPDDPGQHKEPGRGQRSLPGREGAVSAPVKPLHGKRTAAVVITVKAV